MNWFKELISNSEEASTNRLVGVFSFITLLVVILIGLFVTGVDVEIFNTSLQYLFLLIVSALGFKGLEKITGIFKSDKNDKNKYDNIG